MPNVSFGKLAAFLTQLAGQQAAAAERSEILVAQVEAAGAVDLGAEVRHAGLRAAAQTLASTASMTGRAADILRALAPREAEIRAMLGAPPGAAAS